MINKLVLRSPAARWKIANLTRLFLVLRGLKRGMQAIGVLLVVLLVVQLLYPRQVTRPFERLDSTRVGGWSSSKLTAYLNGPAAKRPYDFAVTGHNYKFSPLALGISVNANATAVKATHYSLGERLVPFSLFKQRKLADTKTVDRAALSSGLQKFAGARAQDPEDATLAKQNGIYGAVLPGKPGYVVDVSALQAQVLAAAPGSRLRVPRLAIQPKITESMLQGSLASWRQQTGKPVELKLGPQTVTIPVSTLRNWVIVTPNQKQDAVLVSYDTMAIKAWLSTYAPLVYAAPKPAVRYIQDEALVQTTPGSNGAALDVNKSMAAITAAFKAPGNPVRLANASLQPVAFSTQEARSYSATSRGLQLLINRWAAGYKPGSVAVSFQEIGGQGRSAALNDSQQFFMASIYKLFVEAYAYHLIEAGQLNPDSLVLAAGKSVSACLEITIVNSDNTCPQALGDQLGWLNIDAYAKQQGFTATSLVDHQWSTDTHDAMAYLNGLNAGLLLNPADTAGLLGKMQRQVYRNAIPAGSPGSTVEDKVGFYGSYWHDAAIVHAVKATYVLVVFTNGPGADAIKNLAASVQQTINQ